MKALIFILYSSGIFLVPLVPAYLIYKSLPNRTSVRGPFKGLRVDLTGAFAGYFLLVLIASAFAYFFAAPSKPGCEVWAVTGRIRSAPADANATAMWSDVSEVEIAPIPDDLKIASEGRFVMRIIVEPGVVPGQLEFPCLGVNLRGHVRHQLLLDAADPNVRVIAQERVVKLVEPVLLQRLEDNAERAQWPR